MAEGEGLVSVDYEVSGKVQGVFFRKYTQVAGRGVAWSFLPGCAVPSISAAAAPVGASAGLHGGHGLGSGCLWVGTVLAQCCVM